MIHPRTTFALILLLSCTASANAAVLLHDYQFNGNLEDSLGGPALVADGGTLGAGSYSFGKNQGLTLSNALADAGSYSIALNFNFSALVGWQKIIDFKGKGADAGFYSYGNGLVYSPGWPVGTGVSTLKPFTNADVVVTRDGNTKAFTAYLNGVKQASFIDNNAYAVFSSVDKVMHFFEDDAYAVGTGAFSEAAPGVVNSIRIWDGALSAAEVANINAVPVPGTFWLLGSALAGLGFVGKRRTA